MEPAWTNSTVPELNTDSWVPGVSWQVTLAMTFSTFISNVVFGLTGFGNAIILHICWQLMFLVVDDPAGFKDDLVETVVVYYFMSLTGMIPLFWVARKEIPFRLVLAMLPPSLALGFVGSWALFVVPADTAKKVLGVVFLVFVAWKILQEIKSLPAMEHNAWFQPHTRLRKVMNLLFPATTFEPPDPAEMEQPISCCARAPKVLQQIFSKYAFRRFSWAVLIGGFFAACVSGFLRGMFGVAGPPLMVFVSLASLDKIATRGLNNGMGVIAVPVLAGILLFGQGGWKNSHWLAYLSVVIGGGIGSLVGSRLFPYVDSATLMRIILMLLVLASVVMFSPPFWIEMVVFGIIVLVVILYVIWRIRARAEEARETDAALLQPHDEFNTHFEDDGEIVAPLTTDNNEDEDDESEELVALKSPPSEGLGSSGVHLRLH